MFRIAIAQIKPRKADYPHNLERVADALEQICAMDKRPDVLALSETSLSGYFLEGGVRDAARPAETVFRDLQSAYAERCGGAGSVDVALGFYELHDGKHYNSSLYATLSTDADQAALHHVHRKFFLPTYGVFDEKRFVVRGRSIHAFDTRFGRSAMLICEDAWHSVAPAIAALRGAQVIYVLSASPGRGFGRGTVGNLAKWSFLLPGIATEHSVFVVYAGLVGFEGGKGFSGSSVIVDPFGAERVRGPATDECLLVADIDLDDVAIARASSPLLADLEAALSDVVLELEGVARAARPA
ncbi:MAG TPA: nitrilase-related carbon-nitrogen hydrolase [Chthonomonadales bacterium]|nr:nitrilase-related carbon-nitrogen hydrolase [Chthonomonadales bacterium]